MCTVKKEIDIGCDYELANRNSSDKLLSQIYRRQDSRDSMLTSGSERIVTIHDELAQLRAQINHLQRTVDQLPERICALLKQQQQPCSQNCSSSSAHNGNSFKQTQTLTRMDADNDNEDDDFDKLSSDATSILSDIEILNESIEDNNRDLLAWCRRLQLNDITNHISVEPMKEEPIEPSKPEIRFQSNLFEEWERRYSTASVKPVNSIIKCTESGVPTLVPNYSSEVDKNIWLK